MYLQIQHLQTFTSTWLVLVSIDCLYQLAYSFYPDTLSTIPRTLALSHSISCFLTLVICTNLNYLCFQTIAVAYIRMFISKEIHIFPSNSSMSSNSTSNLPLTGIALSLLKIAISTSNSVYPIVTAILYEAL